MKQQQPNPLLGCAIGLLVTLVFFVFMASALLILPIGAFAGGSVATNSAGGGTGTCTPLPAGSGTPGATLTLPTSSGCSVVAWARTIVDHLSMCGGDPASHTPGFDTCYTTGSAPNAMPQTVLDFLKTTYPGDVGGWTSGSFQCVSLVLAAYGLAGLPMPYQGDAVTFWDHYRTLKEWVAIPAGGTPTPGTAGIPPGLPEPGDMMVWRHTPALPGMYDPGHIAIVIAVTQPTNSQPGSVTFAQSNAFAPTASETITAQPELHVLPWTGGQEYTALGYIRYIGPQSRPTANDVHTFICVALPYARLAQQEETTNPGPGAPTAYSWETPLAHPWYVSVLLAQWGIEQGWHLPGYTGYNWGNSSAIDGFPTIGGTGTVGSPGQFAYANSAEQGVAIHTIFTKMGNYTAVAAAWSQGPLAQATALGISPWDFAQYTHDGNPGDSLTNLIAPTGGNLQRFDDPQATC